MQSLQTIKRRLRGVKNIGQITKAMELVAATKMRRSQEVALASRPYAYAALEFLANLSRVTPDFIPPLLEQRPINKTAIVLVASDKGLTGSFNSAVFRAFEHLPELTRHSVSSQYIAVGQKAVSYLTRRVGNVEQSFVKFGDYINVEEVHPLAQYLIEGFLEKKWDRILIFYTNFKSALQQEVVMRELFPVSFESLRKTAEEIIPKTGKFAAAGAEFFKQEDIPKKKEYLIEPTPEVVLERLIPHLVLMQIYHIILEANASEHSARRLAMKNASDNASEIADMLTLEYNKSRQAGITRELTEITAGAEANASNHS